MSFYYGKMATKTRTQNYNPTTHLWIHILFWYLWSYSVFVNFFVTTPHMRKLLRESHRNYLQGWTYKLYYLTTWNQVSAIAGSWLLCGHFLLMLACMVIVFLPSWRTLSYFVRIVFNPDANVNYNSTSWLPSETIYPSRRNCVKCINKNPS